jgi:hypothetical protein
MEFLSVLEEEMENNHSYVNLEWRRCIMTFLVEVPQRKNSMVRPKNAPVID